MYDGLQDARVANAYVVKQIHMCVLTTKHREYSIATLYRFRGIINGVTTIENFMVSYAYMLITMCIF